MFEQVESKRDYITTPQAAERSDLSKNYIATLLRKGKLEGFQLGRDWLVYTDSLEQFLQTKRKPGPKGPREKITKNKPSDNVAISQNGKK